MPVETDEPTEFNARLDRVTRVASRREVNDNHLAVRPARRAEVQVRDRLTRVADWKADPSLVQSLEWQREAFDYYRLIGQVRYLTTVKANTLAQCRFRLGWRNDQGEIVRTQDPRALRVWNSLKPPKGGFRALVREYARLRDIAGEAFLVGTPTAHDIDTMEARGDSPGLVWEFLSRQEIRGDRPMQSKLYRDPTGVLSLDTRPIDPRALIARWHFSDPGYSSLPDSPLRSAIPDMAEYVALRDVISGSIKSRMSAGILCIPEGMSFGQWDMSMEEGGEARDDMDPLMADLFDHMATPLSSRNSIHAFVPLILMGNAEDLKAVRLIELAPDNDTAWATPLREEKLRMIAQDLDVPPEVMEGRGDSNHWTSLLVDADFASKHIIPAGEDLAVFLSEDFLVPLLAIYEQMDEAEAERFVVIFDPAPITAKADRGVTALRLYQAGLLSGVATVEANDFTTDDMPDEEERRVKTLLEIIRGAPSLAPILLPHIPGFEDIDIPIMVEDGQAPAGRAAPLPATEPGEGDEPTGQSGGDPSSGGGMPDVPDGLSAFDLLVARVHTSAEMAAERALERAGSRALNAAKRATVDPAIRDQFVGRAKRDVFTLLSDRDLGKLGLSAVGLLEGSFEEFERFVVQAVCSFRGDYRDAILDAHDIADRLARDMTTLLASGGGGRTFSGMVVPEDLVRCALEVHLGVGAR